MVSDAQSPEHQNRTDVRVALSIDVKLRVAGGKPVEGRLMDLSVSGFRTEFISRFHTGDRVWLSLPGLAPLAAIVAWSDGVVTGCRFENPMHVAVFEGLIARLR